jgi:hypothetical protein
VQERGITFSPATGRRELTTGVAPMRATRPGNLRPGSSLCVEYLSARFDDDREGYEDAALVGDGGEEAAEHRADDGGDRAGDGESAVEADQLGAGVDVTARGLGDDDPDAQPEKNTGFVIWQALRAVLASTG